jgi:phosphotransferase system HPr (HPr) family protein
LIAKTVDERRTGATVAPGDAAVESTISIADGFETVPPQGPRASISGLGQETGPNGWAAPIGSTYMTEEADEFGLQEVGPQNYRCEVTITNEQGFHMRPVMEFVALAQTFTSEINIYKGNQKVDGKDPFDVLTLEAVAGTLLVIEGRGSDATGALAALARLVRSGFPVTKKPAS